MQNIFDMRTAFFVVSIIGLVLFVCMTFILRTRKTYSGFSFWTASSLFLFLGNLLIGFRNILPGFVTIIISNMFIIFAAWSILHGLTLFANKKRPVWPFVTITFFIFLMLVYFTYYNSNIHARIVIISITFILFCVYALIIIYKHIPPLSKSSNLLLEISFYGTGIWSIFRASYTLLFEKRMEAFLLSSSIQAASIILFSGLFISLFFGLSILNFQRVEDDLFNSKKEIKELEGIVPMCASCKKIRDDSGFWNQVESYIQSRSSAKFSHSICPDCLDKYYSNYKK